MDSQNEHIETEGKCARCCVSVHPFVSDHPGAKSRATMDGEDPVIVVCSACREREVWRGAAGLPAIPWQRWPVPVDALIEEDRLRYEHLRSQPVRAAAPW